VVVVACSSAREWWDCGAKSMQGLWWWLLAALRMSGGTVVVSVCSSARECMRFEIMFWFCVLFHFHFYFMLF
jgi:hypothetical protein